MTNQLTEIKAAKLQKILSKRIGRELSDTELIQAYNNLMEYVYALIDLIPLKHNIDTEESIENSNINNVI